MFRVGFFKKIGGLHFGFSKKMSGMEMLSYAIFVVPIILTVYVMYFTFIFMGYMFYFMGLGIYKGTVLLKNKIKEIQAEKDPR